MQELAEEAACLCSMFLQQVRQRFESIVTVPGPVGLHPAPVWIGNGVLDRFLEDESLFGEFLRTPVSEGGVEPLVVGPPHVVVEVGA